MRSAMGPWTCRKLAANSSTERSSLRYNTTMNLTILHPNPTGRSAPLLRLARRLSRSRTVPGTKVWDRFQLQGQGLLPNDLKPSRFVDQSVFHFFAVLGRDERAVDCF